MKKIFFLMIMMCAFNMNSVFALDSNEAVEATSESIIYSIGNGITLQVVNINIIDAPSTSTLHGYDLKVVNGGSRIATMVLLNEFWKRDSHQEEHFYDYPVVEAGSTYVWQVFRFGIPLYAEDNEWIVTKYSYTLEGSSTVHTGSFTHYL